MTERGPLPRLLYVGDVPVVNTVAGAALLFRLLSSYPPDRLLVHGPRSTVGPSLPGVQYFSTPSGFPRLLRSRFGPWYCAWITWRLQRPARATRARVEQFRPDVVLSVSQTGRWLLAAQLARSRGLPLLLIAHDDHAFEDYLPPLLRPWIAKKFAAVYREAAGRFCISPDMAEVYERRYGVASKVLYPSRDPSRPPAAEPVKRPRSVNGNGAFTFAYAGSVYDAESYSQLGEFAKRAAAGGHRLRIYSPQAPELRRRLAGLAPSLEIRDAVHAARLQSTLREEVDALLVIGSFGADQRELVSTLFPSKMTEYTGTGLPILCWAPDYASISRFVSEFPGVALSCHLREPTSLDAGIAALATDPTVRERLAQEALRVGDEVFSPEVAWKVFRAELDQLSSNDVSQLG